MERESEFTDLEEENENEAEKLFENAKETLQEPLLDIETPSIVDAIVNHDSAAVAAFMRCQCTRHDSKLEFQPCAGWMMRSLPLEVYLSFRTKDVELMIMITDVAIRRLNEAIGRIVLVRVEKLTKFLSTEVRNPLVAVKIAMDHKHGRGHAITKWEPKWNSVHGSKLDRTITIPLCMRKKDDLPLRRRTFEYYSTLTHELVHCLGMAHFPKWEEFRREIIYPCSGGTLIPNIPPSLIDQPVTKEEFPALKASPITIRALRWIYNNPIPHSQGMPIYCDRCKDLGWKF